MRSFFARLGVRGSVTGVAAAILLLTVSIVLLARPGLWDATGAPQRIGSAIHAARIAIEDARFIAELVAAPPAEWLAVPVVGVERDEIADTFGAPRGADRRHEGIDIFAPRGTAVVSATPGIVARIGENRLGGTVVWVVGPGGERYYYAHLDAVDPVLEVGMRVEPGTLIGRVGTTGNATGTPPHLHFGIYGPDGALNPFPRLTDTST